ncbi:hypothetical protein BS78_01G254400 [Paspalum vaginatum]|nr:hypothetical protein BS78_01G254400 [Paspalum vaginatum]
MRAQGLLQICIARKEKRSRLPFGPCLPPAEVGGHTRSASPMLQKQVVATIIRLKVYTKLFSMLPWQQWTYQPTYCIYAGRMEVASDEDPWNADKPEAVVSEDRYKLPRNYTGKLLVSSRPRRIACLREEWMQGIVS